MLWRPIRFKLLELLGEGGQGRVYKALRRDAAAKLEQIVALKILHSKTAVDLWRHEFESLSRVHSPSCVRVLFFERFRGRPALVLEYVEGVSLARLGQSSPLSPADIEEIQAQMEHALRDLHAHGLPHGDLTPQNVLIDKRGKLRLLDFGLANCNGRALRLTPQFSAPERLRGERAGPACDLYALGKLLLYLGANTASVSNYLCESPGKRHFDGRELVPQAERQAALGEVVFMLIERTRLNRNTRTQSSTESRAAVQWKTFVLASISAVFLTASHGSQANRPSPRSLHSGRATLIVRTRKWYYFLLNGRPIGYAPLAIPVSAGENLKLRWVSAGAHGELELNLKPLEERRLDDSDFSH